MRTTTYIIASAGAVCLCALLFIDQWPAVAEEISLAHGEFRRMELPDPNPYAIFGSDAVVLMTDFERMGDHTLEIDNADRNNPARKFQLNTKTGIVKLFDRKGNVVSEQLLSPEQQARFMTQDRFAEKYYSHSPYSYAANNPVLILDINGDSLWINHRGTEVLYVDGTLYNRDGSEYTGKQNRFIRKTVAALGEVSTTNTGNGMISSLQSSSKHFTIVKGDNKFTPSDVYRAYGAQHKADNTVAYQILGASSFEGGSGGKIFWRPSGVSLPTTNGYSNDPAVVLGHEISHAFDANAGRMSDKIVDGLERNEWQAVYRENLTRQDLGLPLRTHYGSTATPDGVKMGGIGPRLLTPANQPFMPWYR